MRPRVELPPAPRFLVGARFVCTKCQTRGVTPRCGCGAKAAALDLTAPVNAGLLAELTSPPKSEGAPTREELFWGGLKSPTQWVLSGVLAMVVCAIVAFDEWAWGFEKVGYAVAEMLLLTVLFRLPMLALELVFRLLVMTLLMLIAALCFIVGKTAGRSRLLTAAGNWLARAERVLNGEYFWRRSMVELRAPPELSEVEYKGALSPSAELCVLVGTGKQGALVLRDADVPLFQVVLVSGETVLVSIEAGALLVHGREPEPSDAKLSSPFFPHTLQIRVSGPSDLLMRGGEWSESDKGAGYRAPLEPRTLRGTLERPLLVEIGRATPARRPRSSP